MYGAKARAMHMQWIQCAVARDMMHDVGDVWEHAKASAVCVSVVCKVCQYL